MGKLWVLSGPSGVGKNVLLEHLLKQYPTSLSESVSATTRAPRPGEEDGIHYHFITCQQFQEDVERETFLEWAQYDHNFYGTPAAPLQSALSSPDRNIISVLEINGARAARKILGKEKVISVFIMPPDMGTLKQRLRERCSEEEEEIERRLEIARWEMAQRREYDYVIANNDLEVAKNELAAYYEYHLKEGDNAYRWGGSNHDDFDYFYH